MSSNTKWGDAGEDDFFELFARLAAAELLEPVTAPSIKWQIAEKNRPWISVLSSGTPALVSALPRQGLPR